MLRYDLEAESRGGARALEPLNTPFRVTKDCTLLSTPSPCLLCVASLFLQLYRDFMECSSKLSRHNNWACSISKLQG